MDAPDPPDAKETAAAQAQMNKETAITQYGLGATNQVTPYGNLTYEQIGQWEDGTPRFQATQSLSPEMQGLYDKYSGIASNLGDIGNTLSSNVKDNYGEPFKLGNEEVESRLFELGSSRLNPRFTEGEDQLRTRLKNQGLEAGTDAWDAEMRRFGETKNDAFNQLLLTGRKQAGDELLTERNQGMNEMLALLSGTQVQNPSFTGTPQPGVSGVDYASLANQEYQAKAGQHQAMMDGLFSLAGTVAGGWARSDRRVKYDIAKVGQLDNGLNVYSFKYIGSKVSQIGLMADEVREIRPEAVVNIGGVDHVRYDLATV